MSWNLDERFSSLESVAVFLNSGEGDSAKRQQILETRFIQKREAEKTRQQELTVQQIDKVRKILDSETSFSLSGFDDVVVEEIECIKELKTERELIQLAIQTDRQLKDDPQEHSETLRNTLVSLQSGQSGNETRDMIIEAIKSQWYDKELQIKLANLRDALAKAGWPKSDPPRHSSEPRNALISALAFDMPDAEATFAVLAEPIAERITFNFRKSEDTARPDKPEWLFAYIQRLLDPRQDWINTTLRSLVSSPLERLVLALVPCIQQTCRVTYTIDSHFVSELIQFGNDLAAKYYCCAETVDKLLFGVLEPDTLERHLSAERDAYLRSLETLLKTASDAVDFDADVGCAKPTFKALNVCQLIQQANSLLRLDAQIVLRMIQLHLLSTYLEWLETRMGLYEKSHSSLARAVGSNKDLPPQEVPDIEYLGRILGASSYLKRFLEMWANELIIAEYATELDQYIAVAENLRSKASSRIADLLTREAQKVLKPYLRIDWSHHTASEEGSVDSSSGALMRSAVDALRPSISFVHRLCPANKSERARITNAFAESFAKAIWRLVIRANIFTSASAKLLQLDVESLWLALDLPDCAPFKKIVEATLLLQTGSFEESSLLSVDEVDELKARRKS